MAGFEEKLNTFLNQTDKFISHDSKKKSHEEAKKFWHEMSTNSDKLTQYLISLICKIIVCDTLQHQTALSEVYESLVTKCESKDGFEKWIALKDKNIQIPKDSNLLRNKLLFTVQFIIHFLPDFNLAQTATCVMRWKSAKEGKMDNLEQITAAFWGEIDIRKLTRGAQIKGSRGQKFQGLLDNCFVGLKKGLCGEFPPLETDLCNPSKLIPSLAYLELIGSLEHNPYLYGTCLTILMQKIMAIVAEESNTAESSKPISTDEQNEIILPVLHIFKELLIRSPYVSQNILDESYKTIFPLFLQPMPYCNFVKEILEFIDVERICPGFHYRRRLLNEHNICVGNREMNTMDIHLITDFVAPHSSNLQAAIKKAERDETYLKKYVLKRAFVAIKSINFDLTFLEKLLDSVDGDLLDKCIADIIELQSCIPEKGRGEPDIYALDKQLNAILAYLIVHYKTKFPLSTEMNNIDFDELQGKTAFFDNLQEFDVPSPHIFTHELNSISVPRQPEEILREIVRKDIFKLNNKTIGPSNLRIPSQYSMPESDSNIDNVRKVSTDSDEHRKKSLTTGTRTFVIRRDRLSSNRDIDSKDSCELDYLGCNDDEDDESPSRKNSIILINNRGEITGTEANKKLSREKYKSMQATNKRIIKLVVAGTDKSIAIITKAYLRIKTEDQALLRDVQFQFYYLPLSAAEPLQDIGTTSVSSGAEFIENLLNHETKYFYENLPTRGGDVWLGRLMAHMDGWYQQAVKLPIQCALNILPEISLDFDETGRPLQAKRKAIKLPISPMKIIRDTIINYTREATYPFLLRNYFVSLHNASGQTSDSLMCQRLEVIQGDNYTMNPKYIGTISKPALLTVTLHAIQYDGAAYPLFQQTDRFFVLKACNVPKPGDFWPANPSCQGFEVHAIVAVKASSNALGRSRYRDGDQRFNWYANQMTIEAAEKDTFSVSIDKDTSIYNLKKLILRPSSEDMSFKEKEGEFNDIYCVPFMTYWPVDL